MFVFAITQVTGYISTDPTWSRLLEGMAILVVLWWAWEAYVWATNSAASDDGPVRVTLLAAMGAMLVVSLAVPGAFDDDALVFAAAYFVVRAMHLVLYGVLSRDDAQLRHAVGRLVPTLGITPSLLIIAAALNGTERRVVWVVAIGWELIALIARGTEGWRVAAGHFAERHGLIIIVALGESIVSLGVGAQGLNLDAGVIMGALLGVAVAAALWWAYFDVVAIVAERRFRGADPEEQVRIARDSYNYLHLPMVAGIILFALGVKKTLGDVGHELATVPAFGLCGGVALYFAAHVGFRLRNVGSLNRQRVVVVVLLMALWPLATAVPALLSLGLVAAIASGLVGYEAWRFAEARDRIRHTL